MEKLLIEIFAELYCMESDYKSWSQERFKDNPPRLIRLQMIQSISKALDVDYEKFLVFGSNHLFNYEVETLPIEKFRSLTYPIIPKHLQHLDFDAKINGKEIEHVFKYVFQIYLNFELLKSTTSGILAANNYFLIPVFVGSALCKKSKKTIKQIKDLLGFILNPQGIQLDKETLIKNFDFPDVNLDEIDMDWI